MLDLIKTAALAVSMICVTATLTATPVVADDKPYKVVDGNKVDPATLEGWHTWRALACDRCHGAHQEGLVGPSLLESLKRLSKDDFKQTVINGRPDKGMPAWGGSKMLQQNIDGLYAYLKGRSDGAIKSGHLYPIK